MAASDAQRFIEALRRLEEAKDAESIVTLFDDRAELSNPVQTKALKGRDGARQFWDTYRGSFQEIHSEFRNVAATDGCALLEWSSRGRALDGTPVEYDGVSVLEFEDGKVSRFRAYFDPAAVQVTTSGRA